MQKGHHQSEDSNTRASKYSKVNLIESTPLQLRPTTRAQRRSTDKIIKPTAPIISLTSPSDGDSSGSETETEMPGYRLDKYESREGSSGSNSVASPKSSSSRSNPTSREKGSKSARVKGEKREKTDDWSEVMEPDERRRIQNRIAQRKFREKAKEAKETQARDAENQQRAGHIYSTASPLDMDTESELSGLPWGGISLRHVVERGQLSRRQSLQHNLETEAYGSGDIYDTGSYYGGYGRGSGSGSGYGDDRSGGGSSN